MRLAIYVKIIERHNGEILVKIRSLKDQFSGNYTCKTTSLNRALVRCLNFLLSGMLIDCYSAPRYDNRQNRIKET